MSRRPKPTAIKVLEGNPGNRKLNDLEPQPAKGVPEMPKGMGVAAKRHWRVFVRELEAVGVLSVVDGIALGEACISAALAEKYRNVALEEPMIKEAMFSKDGTYIGDKWKVNPATAGYITCSKNMKQYLIEFGLTPASRSKLKIEKPKPGEEVPAEGASAFPANDDVDLNAIDETVVN